MKNCIVVLNADPKQCNKFCDLLQNGQYSTTPVYSPQKLDKCIQECSCFAAFIDIDTIPIDNRWVRELTIKYPDTNFFCLSEQSFHPEIKDAICYHIYACIKKPVDPDEIFYWLRSIEENETDH